ncbi:MAG: site-specific integrase [Lachnospiraceae bacterium]|nr:site-specific integrase [Oscillospiraceae bacterium]MBR3279285.1 site-specific integrase [Lachnospiraceae bacterium]
MAVGKKKDGTIYFSVYYEENGEKKRKVQESKSWKTLKDAREAEAAFLARHQAHLCALTFDELYASYLRHQKATRAPATVRNAEMYYRNYFQAFSGLSCDRINNLVIAEWQHGLLKLGLKNGTMERIQKILRGVFNYGVKYDLLPRNPFTVPFVRDREQKPEEMRIWTLEEFEIFLSVIDDFLERAMFRTLFFSACRIGELMALTISDFTGDSLIINKQRTKEGDIQPVKNKNGNRVVPLPQALCEDLRTILRDYYGGAEVSSDWLFCGLAYSSRKQVEYHKNLYAKMAGLEPIRLHDFRHSMVSLLLAENRFTYKEVAQFVGDDVKTIIDTYGHVYGDLDSKIRASMDGFDQRKKSTKSRPKSESTKSLPKKAPIYRS